MTALRVMRTIAPVFMLAFLVECSGAGSQHTSSGASIPNAIPRTIAHRMAFGACTCNTYPDGTLAIYDDINGQIDIYEGPISNSTTASITLSPSCGTNSSGGMTFDPSGDLWVLGCGGAGSTIYEYGAPLTTGESPSLTISGSNTGLLSPDGISYNQSTGDIYVLQSGKILIWSATASGNVAPSTTISSVDIAGVSIKTDANYIYVADATSGIDQFNLTASGSVSPNTTFLSGTQYDNFDFDVEGNIYLDTTGTANSVIRYQYEDNWASSIGFTGGTLGTALYPVVDDTGHVYVTAGTTSGLTSVSTYISSFTGGSPIVTMTGPSRNVNGAALYSPGKFNGDEPQ